MKIAVAGSGGWGTALALMLTKNGHDVTLWSWSAEECAQLAQTRQNPLLPDITLPAEMKITNDMSDINGCKVVVLATPSFAVRSTAKLLRAHLCDGAVVVTVAKGIEPETCLRMSEIIAQEIGSEHPIVALSGPSHAEEVAREVPTAVVSASENQAAAELVQDAFMNPRLRVYTSHDIVGVELGGALKNVVALCAGCCDGMGFGDNTKAMLMTRGLTEIARLGVKMGGTRETFAGLAGMGDLIVTCTSMHSRNRRAGILIGQGTPPEQAVAEIGAVVEGYFAAAAAKTLADRAGVEMPIVEAAYGVLYGGKDVKNALTELMTRQKRHETEESWV